MNKKKMIKAVMTGGALLGSLEFGFALGKGKTIGLLSKDCKDPYADYMIGVLKGHKKMSARFIGKIADHVKND